MTTTPWDLHVSVPSWQLHWQPEPQWCLTTYAHINEKVNLRFNAPQGGPGDDGSTEAPVHSRAHCRPWQLTCSRAQQSRCAAASWSHLAVYVRPCY